MNGLFIWNKLEYTLIGLYGDKKKQWTSSCLVDINDEFDDLNFQIIIEYIVLKTFLDNNQWFSRAMKIQHFQCNEFHIWKSISYVKPISMLFKKKIKTNVISEDNKQISHE